MSTPLKKKSLNLEISLQDKQVEAFEVLNQKPVVFYGGAKGGGKSHLARAWQVHRRLTYPGSTGLFLRKTYGELLSNHIRKFFVEYPIVRKWYNRSEKAIYWPNGSVTEFSYLKRTDDVFNYQGREYDDITIDEVTQHSEEVFKILRTSNRTTNPNIKPTILLTGNPGGVGHGWVKRIFVDREFLPNERESDYGFVQAKINDNQILIQNDPNYLNILKDLPDNLRKAYLDGDWDIFYGQAFTEWRRNKHVIDRLPVSLDECEKFMCFDWGYEKPGCVYWLAKAPENRFGVQRIFCYRELYQRKTSVEKWAKQLAVFTKVENIKYMVLPHDAFNAGIENSRQSISEIFSKKLKTRLVRANTLVKGARHNRKIIMHEFLQDAADGRPYFQTLSTCANLVRSLPALVYDSVDTEDVDTDGEDHAYDAVSTGLLTITNGKGLSGVVRTLRPPTTTKPTFQQDDQGNIKTPDFWGGFKNGTSRRGSPEFKS